MPTTGKKPTYNLKAVVRETGLKPDTLRAWERRYGLPTPQRTEGRHRLYSQDNINTLKWLVARQKEGMSISRAAELWHQLVAAGQDPLLSHDQIAQQRAVVLNASTLADLRDAWLAACMRFDETAAEQALNQAFALYPPEIVCVDLLQRGVSEIGQGWYEGRITVQQEHFATELASRRVDTLISTTPPPNRPHRILMACPAEEDHTFSAVLLTLFLRRRGYDVTYLGSNVPIIRLESTLASVQPRLVILAAQQLHTAATLLETVHFLNQHNLPTAYGGRVFNLLPDLRERIPAHFLGEALEHVPITVDRLLSDNPPTRPNGRTPLGYSEALAHFRANQARVDALIWQHFTLSTAPEMDLNHANMAMASSIIAGLILGDLSLLVTDINWVAGLLNHYNLPLTLLTQYLLAYQHALEKTLDPQISEPILHWLTTLNQTIDLSKINFH